MKRRRDTPYLKYLRSRLGEREAWRSAPADRRGLGSARLGGAAGAARSSSPEPRPAGGGCALRGN